MIILLGSQKGGCGKSTIAINLACGLAQKGCDVILVDADPQQNSRQLGFAIVMKRLCQKYTVFSVMAILKVPSGFKTSVMNMWSLMWQGMIAKNYARRC